MKYFKLLAIVAACLLLTSIFVVLPALSAQPPVDTSTYYVGTIGQPQCLDPARAYDTASGEIIQNVYQTLIWYGSRNTLPFSPGVGTNVSALPNGLSDLSVFEPVIATQVPNRTNGGITVLLNGSELWTFTINPNAQFPSFVDGAGNTIAAHNVTPADVVYSFQRELVFDSDLSPDWMFLQTLYNPAWWNFYDVYAEYDNGTLIGGNESAVANLISGQIYASGGNNVSFVFNYAFPDIAMYQIFAQTWASIVDKTWVIDHGGWNGLFTAGWSNNYRQKPSDVYSELDVYKDPAVWNVSGLTSGSQYSSPTSVPDMLGTGPYKFTSWNKATDTWRIDANPSYWEGWTNAGDGAGNYLHTVIESGIASWPTRKMLFLNGEIDAVVVPTANMYDLLVSTYNPLPGINMDYSIPELETDEIFFCMNVSITSAYQSYVGNPSPHTSDPYFFNDTAIRTAFAWAINYTSYIQQAWFGEAIQHGSWWATGLQPANANDSFLASAPYGLRDENLAEMEYWLDHAALINGVNISTAGFEVNLVYNLGNDQRMIACEAVASAFQALSALTGHSYVVDVTGVDWPTFLTLMGTDGMPGFCLGWLADFADAVDFCGVYMDSTGSFAGLQGTMQFGPSGPIYTAPNTYPADQSIIDAEVTLASTQTNPALRVQEYQDLEGRYYNDCISVALDQPTGRGWARDWVQNRWVNQLLPGLYAYFLYKAPPVSVQNVQLDITHSLVPIVKYSTIYIYQGGMAIGGGITGTFTPMKYFLEVSRDDDNLGAALVYATLGVGRTPGEGADVEEFGNGTYVLIGPLGTANATLTWYEDGVSQVITGTPSPGTLYTVNGSSYPFSPGINDTAPALESVTNGTFHAVTLPGDLNGDGTVDIYDAIVLGGAFGATSSSSNWNPAADINGDGVVDIYDAIILAAHFGGTVTTA